MADLEKYPDAVWDRFFDFAVCDEKSLSRGEVQERLKKLGIDLTKAMNTVQQALQTARAKEELSAAKAKRTGLVNAVNSLVVHVGESLRDKVRQLIEQRSQSDLQAAYFRKLDAAASNEDLQSLLDDMHRLEVWNKGQDDAKPAN